MFWGIKSGVYIYKYLKKIHRVIYNIITPQRGGKNTPFSEKHPCESELATSNFGVLSFLFTFNKPLFIDIL